MLLPPRACVELTLDRRRFLAVNETARPIQIDEGATLRGLRRIPGLRLEPREGPTHAEAVARFVPPLWGPWSTTHSKRGRLCE